MIGKKGVEGLPLKYLVIALVGSLTIGIALQMTGVLRQGVMTGMGVMNQSMTRKIKESAGHKTESVPKFGIDWHFYDNGELRFNIYNEPSNDPTNITEVTATYLGETKNRSNMNIGVASDNNGVKSTGTLNISGLPQEEPGTSVSIRMTINCTTKTNCPATGSLKGEVEAS